MATERRVLNSLDLLPEECQDDVAWALSELNRRERSQTDILFELNDRLAVKGAGPISRSAFSRVRVRLKRRADRLSERDQLYAGVIDRITPEKMADQDIILGELLKTVIDELIDEAKSAGDIKELATAYKNTVAAQNMSAALKAKALKAAEEKALKAVEQVESEMKKTGRPVDGAEILRLIREAYAG